MARYKLIIEYDGGPFVGWQFQENGPSVQGALEEAVFRFCGERVTAHSAGRTDAGVHALGMVAHIDIDKETDAFRLCEALNFHLKPAPIAVLSAVETDKEYHARFSATRRYYRYRIINRRAPLTVDAGRAWRLSPPIDADAMHEASQILIGKHDFTTFRASTCQAESPVKTLSAIAVKRAGDEVHIETSARSFLHHQVRSIAGSLVEVGFGRWSAKGFESAFRACDRARCAQVAPAEGLYFLKADYE